MQGLKVTFFPNQTRIVDSSDISKSERKLKFVQGSESLRSWTAFLCKANKVNSNFRQQMLNIYASSAEIADVNNCFNSIQFNL